MGGKNIHFQRQLPLAKKNTVYWGNWSRLGWRFHQRKCNATILLPPFHFTHVTIDQRNILARGHATLWLTPSSFIFCCNKWGNKHFQISFDSGQLYSLIPPPPPLIEAHKCRTASCVCVWVWFFFKSNAKRQLEMMPLPSFYGGIFLFEMQKVNKASMAEADTQLNSHPHMKAFR